MTPASFPVATTRAWPLFSILLGANLLAWGWAWAMFAAHPADDEGKARPAHEPDQAARHHHAQTAPTHRRPS